MINLVLEEMLSLDVGCGWEKGHIKRGDIGLDLNRGICDLLGDAQYLPFTDGVFDGCYAYALLEHVDNPIKVLTEIHRVLKPDGWLNILLPTDSRLKLDYITRILNFDFKGVLRQYRAIRAGEHKWQFSEAFIKDLLTSLGFHIKDLQYPAQPLLYGRKGRILRIARHPHLVIGTTKSSRTEEPSVSIPM